MSSSPSIQSLTDTAPIALLGLEGIIILTIIGLWLIKLYVLQQLPDVKTQRQPHFLSKQLGLLVSFATILLFGIAIAIWFIGTHAIDTLQEASHLEIKQAKPIISTQQPDPVKPSEILDIFETPDKRDITLESIKTRYENALSGAYILHNCDKATEQEIKALLGALRHDITATQAQNPDQIIDDIQSLYASIVSAAEGSYHMIYANIPCDTPQVAMLEQKFANFLMKHQANSK